MKKTHYKKMQMIGSVTSNEIRRFIMTFSFVRRYNFQRYEQKQVPGNKTDTSKRDKDKLYKLRLLITLLYKHIRQSGIFHRYLLIDEVMIKFFI